MCVCVFCPQVSRDHQHPGREDLRSGSSQPGQEAVGHGRGLGVSGVLQPQQTGGEAPSSRSQRRRPVVSSVPTPSGGRLSDPGEGWNGPFCCFAAPSQTRRARGRQHTPPHKCESSCFAWRISLFVGFGDVFFFFFLHTSTTRPTSVHAR